MCCVSVLSGSWGRFLCHKPLSVPFPRLRSSAMQARCNRIPQVCSPQVYMMLRLVCGGWLKYAGRAVRPAAAGRAGARGPAGATLYLSPRLHSPWLVVRVAASVVCAWWGDWGSVVVAWIS